MMLDCWRRLGHVERSLREARAAAGWLLVITLLGLPIVAMTHFEGQRLQLDLGSGFWIGSMIGTIVYGGRVIGLARARRRLIEALEREAASL